MTPEEKLAALGLADVELIDHKEYDRLPDHKRAVRTVLVRLPDPPPVAALRRIVDLAERHGVEAHGEGLQSCATVARIADTAADALAEFDGTMT